MNFTEFKPHGQLAPFIDAYWEVGCKQNGCSVDKVLPDGCVDIIINLGDDFRIDAENVTLTSEKAYLGGTLTHFMEAKTLPSTHLAGVRFKPSAFAHFYSFSSLHEATNKFIELSKDLVPGINSLSNSITTAFDAFFCNKLSLPKTSLLPIVETVKQHHGDLSIKQLANTHFTTIRQLERNFKYYIGLSPKEFANIIRYRYAHQLILKRRPKTTLLDIAVDCGYCDQAHLCNEMKKYTGAAPSHLAKFAG